MKSIRASRPRARLAAALTIALACSGVSSADAQDGPVRLAVRPANDADVTFLVERTEVDSRGPVGRKPAPQKTSVTSLVRVRGKAAADTGDHTLAITFLRVKGVISGGQLTEPVTFSRNTKDAPDGRPETALVGRTVEMDVRADGTITAVRGVDAESTGSATVAAATITDLSALVNPLPGGAVAEGISWPGDALEGRSLLRHRVVTRNLCTRLATDHAEIEVTGKLAPAPSGAPAAFAQSIRLLKGVRRGTYRVSLADGLPVVARRVTDFSVEAPLTASDVEVRVTTHTIVTVRRRDAAGADADLRRRAPRPGEKTPNTRLPAWIGTSRTALRRLVGDPPVDSPDGDFDAYPEMGLIYLFDADGRVREIDASGVGDGFSGRILGVQVGDLLADAEKLWGRPTERAAGEGSHDVATFAFDDLTLKLEVARTAVPGKTMADEIVRITVRSIK